MCICLLLMAQFAIEFSVYSKFLFTRCRSARLFIYLLVCLFELVLSLLRLLRSVSFVAIVVVVLVEIRVQMFLITGHYMACKIQRWNEAFCPPFPARMIAQLYAINFVNSIEQTDRMSIKIFIYWIGIFGNWNQRSIPRGSHTQYSFYCQFELRSGFHGLIICKTWWEYKKMFFLYHTTQWWRCCVQCACNHIDVFHFSISSSSLSAHRSLTEYVHWVSPRTQFLYSIQLYSPNISNARHISLLLALFRLSVHTHLELLVRLFSFILFKFSTTAYHKCMRCVSVCACIKCIESSNERKTKTYELAIFPAWYFILLLCFLFGRMERESKWDRNHKINMI